ncbi:hypothetical protein [Paenibacillus popilliae]|uniref:Uncharacterized protein n=1 Tax=Paenibacillus popilliae ATCC 14706 TaxID=1212764 RepID=M9LM87_PAEPP|nr:hypothetical protein [Paenibacillus popilliae]GAC41211.1 hypothetical protein PPOP_0561 [Paenibacillus popilliae ATCC 14706]
MKFKKLITLSLVAVSIMTPTQAAFATKVTVDTRNNGKGGGQVTKVYCPKTCEIHIK